MVDGTMRYRGTTGGHNDGSGDVYVEGGRVVYRGIKERFLWST